jgi:hypothetical protein
MFKPQKNKIFKYCICILMIVLLFSCKKNNKNKFSTTSTEPKIFYEIKQTDIQLEGFFEIKWGDSVENACKILRNKNVRLSGISNEMVIAEGHFAGYKGSFALFFYRNQFYSGNIGYYENKDEKIYHEFVNNLKEKYGEPDFTDNTGDYKMTIWRFVNGCKITASFSDHLYLSYGNEKLINELTENEAFNDL